MAEEDLKFESYSDHEREVTGDGMEGTFALYPDEDRAPPIGLKEAHDKAEKTHLALGDKSPGKDALVRTAHSGIGDKSLREQFVLSTKADETGRSIALVDQYLRHREKKNTPLSTSEIQYLTTLNQEEQKSLVSDPGTFFEKSYSKYISDSIVENHEVYRKAVNENPTLAQEVKMRGREFAAKAQSFRDLAQQASTDFGDASTLSIIANVTAEFIPMYSWWARASDKAGTTSSYYSGANTAEMVRNIHLLPHDEAVARAKLVIADIASRSKLQAMAFANALVSYSDTEEGLDDLFTGIDIGTSGVIGALASLVKGSARTGRAVKAVTQSNIQTAQGNLHQAAKLDLAAEFSKQADRVRGQIDSLGEIKKDVATIFDVDSVVSGTKNMGAAHLSRLRDTLLNNANLLIKAGLTNPLNIRRLEGTALDTALDEAGRAIARTYRHLPDTIVDVVPKFDANTPFGVDQIAVRFGKHDGTLFDTSDNARLIAKHVFELPDGGWNVGQEGGKYFIEVLKNVDESLPSIRTALQTATDAQRVRSAVNMVTGVLRGNDYVLPKGVLSGMKTATFGGNTIFKTFKELGQEFHKLGKDRPEFFDFVSAQQKYVDPANPLTVGKFNNTVGEFISDWQKMYNKAPTEQQTVAYFTYKQINDIEYMVNNLSIYRDKARVGLANYRIAIEGVKSEKLEGKLVREIPWTNQENTGILVLEDTIANSRAMSKDFFSAARRQEINEGIQRGIYKVVHLSSDGKQTLRNTDELRPLLEKSPDVSFVVSKVADESPLDFKQLSYNPGGHIIYKDEFFMKQAKIRRSTGAGGRTEHLYDGDTAIFNFQNRAQGQKFAKAMDDARINLRDNGSSPALKTFVEKNLPMSYADFTRTFSKEGPLSLNQPIVVTSGDQGVADVINYSNRLENFRKSSDSVYNLYDSVNLRNAQERGTILKTIVESGTEANPIISTKQAEVIDPFTAMDRAASLLMQGRYMDNAKQKAAMNFVAHYEDVLDLTNPRYNNNPVLALLDAPIKKDHLDKAMMASARDYRRRAKEFFGAKTPEHQYWDHARWSIADGIYQRLGQKAIDRMPNFMLAKEKDPVKFFRTIAFHTKLGMLNPVQLFQQAQTMVNVVGVAGARNGLPSVPAAFLMRTLDVNPDMLKAASKHATKFGWKADDFVESYEALKRTGFDIVGREVTQRGDYFDQSIITQGKLAGALDYATVFFTEGERITRLTGWSAAYREWRTANVGAKLTDDVVQQILQRADDLTVNMSRASNASWQQGVLSIPTQFMSYQVRLMEQFIGGKLTLEEKVRLFLTNGLMYGFPVATSGVVGVWPVHEEIKKELLRQGIDVEASVVDQAFTDGIGGMLLQLITDERNNFGERMGPGGIPLFRDLLMGKKEVVEMFTGPSGSIIGEFLANGAPLIASYMNIFTGDESWYPIHETELIKFASTISSVNQGRNIYNALFLNQYVTKNGLIVKEQDSWAGVINGMIGTSPAEVSDLFRQFDVNKDLKKHQQEVTKDLVQLNRMMLNTPDLDTKTALANQIKLHLKRGGFEGHQLTRVLKEMNRGNEHLIDKHMRAIQSYPPAQLELWINKQRRRNEKKDAQ